MSTALLATSAAATFAAVAFTFRLVRRAAGVRHRRAVEALLATDRLPGPGARVGRPVIAQAVATQFSLQCEGVELLVATAEFRIEVSDDGLTAAGPSGWHLPHARIVEAVFVARQGRWASGPSGVLLRVTWRQAERTVTTALFVHGHRREAEKLRKELHLRAGAARPLAGP